MFSKSLCKLSLWLAFTVLVGLIAFGHARQQPKASARHLILGVPFVSWGEAAALNYRAKNVLEPSAAAVNAMDLEYWGYSARLLEDQKPAFDQWPNVSKKGASLDDIKQLVDRDIPVQVHPTLTPFAHRLYVVFAILAQLEGVELQTGGSSTNMLGQMVSLKKLAELKDKNSEAIVNESSDVAARLVIGYDDKRQVIIMHDPSFGPAWEVSYADFDKMWGFYGRSLHALVPPDSAKILASKPAPGPYPPRTSDNEAAVHYVYGYADEFIGRTEDAEREFRQGLAIVGISTAYQHLLHFELASALAYQGRGDDAIAEAQKAIDLYPDDPAPWQFLAVQLKRFQAGSNWKKRADVASKRAAALCTEQNERKVAGVLAKDFRIVGCKGQYLGWGLR